MYLKLAPISAPVLTLALFLAVLPVSTRSDTSPELVLRTVAEQVTEGADADGQDISVLVPAERLTVDDELIYTVAFTNTSDTPLLSAELVYRVPRYMRYVTGSAIGPGTDISFSVDGGRTYGNPEELVIIDREGHRRLARAEDYTDIRWRLRYALDSGAMGYARFRARMR